MRWLIDLVSGKRFVSAPHLIFSGETCQLAAGEELDSACILDKDQPKKRWVFRGCFSGRYDEDPGVFWGKDWEPITADSCQEHLVTVVCGWNRLYRDSRFAFMQDNASSHAAAATIKELRRALSKVMSHAKCATSLNPCQLPEIQCVESSHNELAAMSSIVLGVIGGPACHVVSISCYKISSL